MPQLTFKFNRWCGIAVAAFSLATLIGTGASQAACATTDVRMRRMFRELPTETIAVIAHRGVWGRYSGRNLPENSYGAVTESDLQCMDGVELDVKETSDHAVIIMHDFMLGRTTDIYNQYRGGTKFDPRAGSGTNPTVDSVPWATVEKLRLLTPDRSSVTNYTVPELWQLLDKYKRDGMDVPLVFDAKTRSAVQAINRAATQRLNAPRSTVAIKVNATLYPTYQAFVRDADQVRGIPVFQTNMLSKIDVITAQLNWRSGSHAVEVNLKQENGLLGANMTVAKLSKMALGVFNAIPDGPADDQFYYNTGACCYRLSDLYSSHDGRSDTADKRGDWNFILSQGFTFVTTDDAKGLIRYLRTKGKY